MTDLERIEGLWEHGRWADEAIEVALGQAAAQITHLDDALREYAHILAAQEVWLARIEGRPATQPLWPDVDLDEAAQLRRRLVAEYADLLAGLDSPDLDRTIEYENSAGRSFQTPLGEILLHVALHGQYHRGKINLLLRQAGCSPKPVDYIAFVRGAPAAVTPLDDGP